MIAICSELRSEVERNQNRVIVGDVLLYIDGENCQKWEVIELFDGGFEAKDNYETRDFWFHELQYGWQFSEKTKEYHRIFDKFKF